MRGVYIPVEVPKAVAEESLHANCRPDMIELRLKRRKIESHTLIHSLLPKVAMETECFTKLN